MSINHLTKNTSCKSQLLLIMWAFSPSLTVTHHCSPIWSYKHPTRTKLLINHLSVISSSEVSRNDSCPDLPEIQNGWKTTSHVALVRGAQITYQCDPGYDLVGRETLTCQLDLTWSSQPPFCEKSQFCSILP